MVIKKHCCHEILNLPAKKQPCNEIITAKQSLLSANFNGKPFSSITKAYSCR